LKPKRGGGPRSLSGCPWTNNLNQPNAMKYNIIFVDDEPKILDGLRRMLRGMCDEWDMSFAVSGKQALEMMDEKDFDVIVSDMRMPEMDGAKLLTEVMNRYPRTVRIILSGYSDVDLVIKTVLPAHQYLSKPCDSEKLKSVINQALKVRSIVGDESVRGLVSKIEKLPVVPQIYHELIRELDSQEPSLDKIGKIVSRDVAMSAQLIKLVNSPFFGFCRKISRPEQAVTLLGVNTIRTLILTVHLFTVLDCSQLKDFSVSLLWEHCLRVGRLAKELSVVEGKDKDFADNCFMAGMLHDVGKLAMATLDADRYNRVLDTVRTGDSTVWEVEKEVFGPTYAEVGAYLMGLWGLPYPLVEAIAFHHAPLTLFKGFDAPMAVYLADVMDHIHYIVNQDYKKPELDTDLLKAKGLADRVAAWEARVEEIYSGYSENGEQDSHS